MAIEMVESGVNPKKYDFGFQNANGQPYGYKVASGQQEYNNFLGIGKGKEKDRYEETLKNVQSWVPLHSNLTCEQMAKDIKNINIEINKLEAKKAGGVSGGEERTTNRLLKAWNEQLANFQTKYNQMNCAIKKEESETSDWIDKTEEALDSQENQVFATSRRNKYLIYGLAALVGVTGIYLIMR